MISLHTRLLEPLSRLVVLLVLALVLCGTARGQFNDGNNGGGGSSSGGGGNAGGSYYNYSTEGGLSMQINVWGFVRSPGKFNVSSATRLVEIISFAGGPTDRARLDDIRIVHDMRIDSTIPEPVDIFNLEEWYRSGDTLSNPLLYANDTIIVPGDALNVFREILGIIRDVALVIGTLIALFVAVSPGKTN
jgi:polysaccharide export outer membrane protein